MILQETLEKMVKESVAKLLTYSADGIGNVTFSDIAENTKKEMNALGIPPHRSSFEHEPEVSERKNLSGKIW